MAASRAQLLGAAVIVALFLHSTFVGAQSDLLPTKASTSLPAANTAIEAVQDNDTAAFIFDNFNTWAFCQYPISGNYGLLPRILFYCTLVFALVAKHHDWLIGGALAAALTYSGSAAIHACILIWRGPSYGDSDVQALVAILSASCIIIVPLLNWSSTLRRIGARKIILYWSVLVTVGFISVFVAVWAYLLSWNLYVYETFNIAYEPTIWWPDDLTLMNVEYEVNVSAILGCTPPHKFDGYGGYTITPQFATDYRCENPCANFHGMSLFRTDSEIQLLDFDQANAALGWVTPSVAKTQAFVYGYDTYGLIMLPYILIQGFWAAFFGRRSPAQVRDNFYIFLKGLRLRKNGLRMTRLPSGRLAELTGTSWRETGLLQKLFAKYWALLIYAWAILITLICPPLFIINVVANELSLAQLLESEPPTTIGQWSSWASTGLVLFAALVGKYHDLYVSNVIRATNYTLWRMRGRPEKARKPSWAGVDGPGAQSQGRTEFQMMRLNESAEQPLYSDSYAKIGRKLEADAGRSAKRRWRHLTGPIKQFFTWLHHEWINVWEFWEDPDLIARQWLRHPLDHSTGASALIAQLHSNSFPLDVRGLEIERRPTFTRQNTDTETNSDAVIALGGIQPMKKIKTKEKAEARRAHLDRTLLPGYNAYRTHRSEYVTETPPKTATVSATEEGSMEDEISSNQSHSTTIQFQDPNSKPGRS